MQDAAGICSVMQAEHCNTESKNQFLYKCLFLTLYETTLRIFSIQRSVLALSLLVFWVFADYSDATLSLNDFALFTNWFYRRSNLHFISLLSKKVHLLLQHQMIYFASRNFLFFKVFLFSFYINACNTQKQGKTRIYYAFLPC